VPSAADIAKHDFSAAEAQDHVRGFLYRDFGLALWYELRAYVVDVLATDARYLSSFHVDAELSAWFHQLFDDTDGARFSLRNRVHPGSDIDSLVDLLTQIIFTATAQHATVNFPQYDFLAFFPARPLGLMRPMPPAPAVPSEMYMLQALPDSDGIQLAQTTFDILSSCCADTLLDDPPVDAHGHTPHSGLLHGDDVTPRSFPAQWSALSRRLKQLETHERAHAEAQQFGDQYPYLYPSRIPMSTAQ
jgi:arachidonate 15-lipoxygenase